MIEWKDKQEVDVWNVVFATALATGPMSGITPRRADEMADKAVLSLRSLWKSELKKNPDREYPPSE